MAGWQIPLEGVRAPQLNPYQAAVQGQDQALQAQAMRAQLAQQQAMNPLQQQQAQQQIEAGGMANQQAALQLNIQRQLARSYQEAAAAGMQQQTAPPVAPLQPTTASPYDPANPITAVTGANIAPPAPPAGYVPPVAQPAQNPGPGIGRPVAAQFHQNLIDRMYANGLGAQVPGVEKAYTDMGINQAKLVSDQADAHQKLAEQATQILQGVAALPPDQRDAEYQRVLPQVAHLEQQMGSDPNQLPQRWDDTIGNGLIAQGTKVSDYANHLRQAAETARLAQEGIVQTAPKAADYVQKELASVTTPQQFDELKSRIEAYAQQEKQANPNGQSYFQAALDKLPPTWNQGLQRQSLLASLPPQDRVTELQKEFQNTATRLSIAAQQGPDVYAQQLAQVAPEDRPLFDQKWTADTAENARRAGLTANQAGIEDLKNVQLSVAEMRAKFAEALANAHIGALQNSPNATKNQIDQWAERAVKNSGGFDKAIQDVRNPDLYVDANTNAPGLADHREQVAQQILNWQKNGLRKDLLTNQVDLSGLNTVAKKNATALMGAFNDKFGGAPAQGKTGVANQPANNIRTAPAKTPAPSATPISVKAGDGSLHQFPNEAAAAQFEKLVKSAGGSTSRQ